MVEYEKDNKKKAEEYAQMYVNYGGNLITLGAALILLLQDVTKKEISINVVKPSLKSKK